MLFWTDFFAKVSHFLHEGLICLDGGDELWHSEPAVGIPRRHG